MSEHPAAVADRLFSSFILPLVMGGRMPLQRPLGPSAALALSSHHRPADIDAFSRVGVQRVRVARRLYPLDTLDVPSDAEWQLAAALHDIVQSTHPALAQRFGGRRAVRTLTLAKATLQRIEAARNAHDALSRHSLFSRILEVTRIERRAKWWTGQASFVGTDPPARLLAWQQVRRVHVQELPTRLLGLPAAGSAHHTAFATAMAQALDLTPLTDFATLTRAWPRFTFTEHNLGLIAAPAGRALVLRVLRERSHAELDAALGPAFEQLLTQAPRHPLLEHPLRLLGELILQRLTFDKDKSAPTAPPSLVRAASARAAQALLAGAGPHFGPALPGLHAALTALATSPRETAMQLDAAWPQVPELLRS